MEIQGMSQHSENLMSTAWGHVMIQLTAEEETKKICYVETSFELRKPECKHHIKRLIAN